MYGQPSEADDPEAVNSFKTRNRGQSTELGRLKAVNFKPRPDDVFLVTPQKCGTTWAQQIIHSLRTRGSMDFNEIGLVFPHIEYAHDYGYADLDAPQVAWPRCFKTHFWYPYVPKGAKYIVLFREPLEVGPSCYNFLKNWLFTPEELSLDTFIKEIFLGRGAPTNIMENAAFWCILTSWYPHRLDPNVLWLHFEDLQQNQAACIQLIADFIGVGGNDHELLALVGWQASLDFMLQHADKFDEHHFKQVRATRALRRRVATGNLFCVWGTFNNLDRPSQVRLLEQARNKAMGLPADAGMGGSLENNKIAERVNHRSRLSLEAIQAINDRWAREVEPVTGYKNYKEMRDGINIELGRHYFLLDEGVESVTESISETAESSH